MKPIVQQDKKRFDEQMVERIKMIELNFLKHIQSGSLPAMS